MATYMHTHQIILDIFGSPTESQWAPRNVHDMCDENTTIVFSILHGRLAYSGPQSAQYGGTLFPILA